MEYKYSTKCPVHGRILKTQRTQFFKYAGKVYSGPTFYCAKCNKYYMIIKGGLPCARLKGTDQSGTNICIRSGSVEKIPLEKKVDKNDKSICEVKKNKEKVKDGTSVKKKTQKERKRNKKHDAFIEKLQTSINQIHCEMKCPVHSDRVMMTKNCIDVENHRALPLFYCVDCDCYYISCNELKNMRLGQLNHKDFISCDCSIRVINPGNGKLSNIGVYKGTVTLEKEESIHPEKIQDILEKEEPIYPENSFIEHEKEALIVQNSSVENEIVHNEIEDEKDSLLSLIEDTFENEQIKVIKPDITLRKENIIKPKEYISNEIVFDDWSFEDTENELYKEFLQDT